MALMSDKPVPGVPFYKISATRREELDEEADGDEPEISQAARDSLLEELLDRIFGKAQKKTAAKDKP